MRISTIMCAGICLIIKTHLSHEVHSRTEKVYSVKDRYAMGFNIRRIDRILD